MSRIVLCLTALSLLVTQALGAPRTWTDDFTTMATYNSTAWLAPCYGGPSTKYTVMNVFTGDIVNQRALSGNGKLVYTMREPEPTGYTSAITEFSAVGVLNFSQGCPDVAGVPFYHSTEEFTSPDVCIYGGIEFTPWHLKAARNCFQGSPGVEGVDDDNDSQTDEYDESPILRPTTVNNGYGNRDGTGFKAGQDDAPGIATIDDDANGLTDEYGEIGWAGTDDGNDHSHHNHWAFMRGNVYTSSCIYANWDLAWSDSQFALYEVDNLLYAEREPTNEIVYGFYQPYTPYNWVFCVSGSVYGAMLWTGTDMSNPDETLGPMLNTVHNNLVDDNLVGFGYATWNDATSGHFLRNMAFRGNSNFDDTYYVISGDSNTHFPPITADFDNDHDVDGQDFMKFSKCFNGSLRPPKATCENPEANFDGDIDVDGQDFMAFSKCFNGSLRRPKCLPPTLTFGDAPPNDTCSGALEVFNGSTPDQVTNLTSSSYSHSCTGWGLDLWYVYTPTCTGTATISVCNSGIAYLGLAVYDGCPDVGGNEIDCANSNTCGSADASRETLTVPVTQGAPIYIAVVSNRYGFGYRTGSVALDISCAP